jgi:tetratricopeptide (TPR) repeat protein
MTPEQIDEHNLIFKEASQLVKEEVIVAGRPPASGLDRSGRVKLERAIHLFARVLELNSRNWSAMWLVGKAYQRLGNYSAALTSFVRASEVNRGQPDVLREASICAMYMGLSEEAISYADSALRCQPSNNGLLANLALALLLAGRLDEAKTAIDKAMTSGADAISQTVGSMVDHFIANERTPPTTTEALEGYWKKRSTRNSGSF